MYDIKIHIHILEEMAKLKEVMSGLQDQAKNNQRGQIFLCFKKLVWI